MTFKVENAVRNWCKSIRRTRNEIITVQFLHLNDERVTPSFPSLRAKYTVIFCL